MGVAMMLLGLFLVVLAIIGPICGIIALVRVREVTKTVKGLQDRLRTRQPSPMQKQQTPPPLEKEIVPEELHLPVGITPPPEAPLSELAPVILPATPVPVPPEEKITEPPSPKPPQDSLEMILGTKWLNWIGIVMLLIGIGFFLKYAYDNAWIGPKGRLVIGTLFGIALITFGERFRRRRWDMLFQALTGGGLATFYLCVFFSFQVYHLSDQTMSMMLAILVTALAVVMAVVHSTVSIAVLALIGGFLSPVLLSTGVNRPYALFTYIAILNLVAVGAAYFRRWRGLNLLSFFGTLIIYIGWYGKFYGPDQMQPALIYISLFYLMFLIIPSLHSLVRRMPQDLEDLLLIVFNAIFAFSIFYNVLFQDYRYTMGFVVLGQAILVFILFWIWARRVGTNNPTSAGLLVIALGLVLLAVPIQLKLYGIPIAWGMEGAVLVLLGIRFRQVICRVAGITALVLAVGGLVARLPLHNLSFTPVINIPFGSWAFVIAMAIISTYYLQRDRRDNDRDQDILPDIAFLLSFSLACFLLSMEIWLFWSINQPVEYYNSYKTTSLVVLWSLIPAITVYVIRRKTAWAWMPMAWTGFFFGICSLIGSLTYYNLPSSIPILNLAFAPKLIFVFSLWWAARLFRQSNFKMEGDILRLAGHGVLARLLAFECARWGLYSPLISEKMGLSLISAAWALQAVAVIWIGLVTKNRSLRYMGFVLFGGSLLIGSITFYNLPFSIPILNLAFAPKLIFVFSLWWAARLFRKSYFEMEGNILRLAGHGVLALLVAFECARWGLYSPLISEKMGLSLISAAWALQAVVVIWMGLVTRNSSLRYMGFVLFGLAIGKALLIDMSGMEKVYRMVSFIACGLLMVVAGYFYHRYSSKLLQPETEKEE